MNLNVKNKIPPTWAESSHFDTLKVSRTFWLVLIAASVLAIGIAYRWDLFFYDGIYYFRNALSRAHFKPGYPPLYDRWTHSNFVWLALTKLGGYSAFSFHAMIWIYRALMYAAIFSWWKVFCRFWPEKSLHAWGLFLFITSPLLIYAPHQVVPEQWALLFSGIGTLSFLFAVDRKKWFVLPLSALLFYLAFLSRSDGLLLPTALLGSCLLFGYGARSNFLKASVITGVFFLPLLAWHINQVGGGNLAPMLKAMWNYGGGDLEDDLREMWYAAGLLLPLAGLALFRWKHDNNVRILGATFLAIYLFFLGFILSGRFILGRHTIQGVFAAAAFGTLGFSFLISGLSKKWKKEHLLILFFVVCVPLHIYFANKAAAGVNIDRAKEIFETIQQKDPGSVLLVADDPTYYFYHVYYHDAEEIKIFLVYAGGTPETKANFRKELEPVLGDRYISSLEELQALGEKSFYYLGHPMNSWLGDEKTITLRDAGLGDYKGETLMILENSANI